MRARRQSHPAPRRRPAPGRLRSGARLATLPLTVATAVMVVWGATPVVTRLATDGLDPLVVAIFRTLIGAVFALALLAVAPFPIPRATVPRATGQRWLLLASAVSGFVAFPLLFTVGQERTSAMHGGIILAGLPIVTGSYAAIVDRRRPTRFWLVGCAIALAGEAVVVAIRTGSAANNATLGGDLLVVAASLAVAAGYVAGARLAGEGYPSLSTTLYGIVIAAVLLLVPGIAVLVHYGVRLQAAGSWGAVVWLATMTSIVGYVGWYWALARGGVARIATLQFLQPISGLILAAAILGERLTLPLAVGAVAILVGVTVAQRR